MEHYAPGGGHDGRQERAAGAGDIGTGGAAPGDVGGASAGGGEYGAPGGAGTYGQGTEFGAGYPEGGAYQGRGRLRSRGKANKAGRARGEAKPKGGAARTGVIVFLIFLVFALLSVIFCFLWIITAPDAPAPVESQKEILRVEPSEDELEARGWVPSDKIKKYAEEFNINTEFLSRLFPNKIIYKDGGKIYYASVNPDLKKHPYDWRALSWENKRPVYAGASGDSALLGIDVSKYQGAINWGKVAADGVSFAMIRMGYRGYGSGDIVTDEYFEGNIKQAGEAGVRIGIYFFSQAVTEAEAVEEADAVLAAIAGHSVAFPIVFDMEEVAGSKARVDALASGQVTAIAAAFCERVKAAGYTPMIYANPKWFISRMDLEKLEDYDKWLAQYYSTPAFPYDFTIWQFSDSGKVSGISGNVDMNLAFVDYSRR
ncbi:MAG: glycoside hydrolase family 25 protein [Clostridiales Family XIII bacterium]|jgi:GH25 family lysozyme M1 (1,4-beta-N-acetylmuramidase)|nr:glycoside hydrolase family 25 protein [Clostridiales Family XIII bacterium]